MLQVNVEGRYMAEDVLSHPWVTVPHSCLSPRARKVVQPRLILAPFQDGKLFEKNMMMEVTGKLKTHFNTEPKPSETTAGVAVIMVSTENIHMANPEHLSASLWLNICRFSVFSRF